MTNSNIVTLETVRKDPEIEALINCSAHCLEFMQYTEHGKRHANRVSATAGMILEKIGFDPRSVELAKIAGYIHDVGNAVNRMHHGLSGATLVYPILIRMGMPYEEVCLLVSAIGNHEEQYGEPVNHIAAALILADKADAHCTRVAKLPIDVNDIHDRVNYAIKKNSVQVNTESKEICYKIFMSSIASVMDYFEIYLSRIVLADKAAHALNCIFKLFINGVLINTPKPLNKKTLDNIDEE